jgi:hypothetical protein
VRLLQSLVSFNLVSFEFPESGADFDLIEAGPCYTALPGSVLPAR